MVCDSLDFLRGIEVLLNFFPAASIEEIRRGMADLGVNRSNQAVVLGQLLDPNPLFLTGKTDMVYCMVMLDLETDGPTVVEIPAGSGPGTVNDAFLPLRRRHGGTRSRPGKGGRYLIVPPGYTGELPNDVEDGGDYFIAKMRSYLNRLSLRGYLADGKPDAAANMVRTGLKVHPLSHQNSPPAMEFITGSRVPVNTVHVIQKEPADSIDPEPRGLAAANGIRKGKRFAPDARMTAVLTDAVAVGNSTARAMGFRMREPRSALT